MNERFSITNETKGKLPRLPFLEMKEAILGKRYDLDLVFAHEKKTRLLNHVYREKDYAANVLAFPLTANEGEIVISPARARIEAPRFGRTYESFLGFLFIHGLLHLKGHTHGSTMESEEKRFSSRFLGEKNPSNTHGKKIIRRNRHRDLPSKGHDRRRSRRS